MSEKVVDVNPITSFFLRYPSHWKTPQVLRQELIQEDKIRAVTAFQKDILQVGQTENGSRSFAIEWSGAGGIFD